MKRCSGCSRDLAFDQFNKKKRSPDGLQSWCRACNAERSRKYYANHPAEVKRAIKEREKKRRKALQCEVRQYLRSKGCEICGFSDPRALEFDHIDRSTKVACVARLIVLGNRSRVFEEIAKCRVLCANCHRIHTAEQMGWWVGIEDAVFPENYVSRRNRQDENIL